MSKSILVAGTIVVALLISSFPLDAAEIYGCAQKINGQLRIVSSPNQCRPSEENIIILGGTNSVEPPIPNLLGSWNLSCERYSIADDGVTRTYETGTGSMSVTLQQEHSFTGYIYLGPQTDDYQTLMTGVTNGNQITMNWAETSIWIGQYNPITNTLQLTAADHNHDKAFGTIRCVGTR